LFTLHSYAQNDGQTKAFKPPQSAISNIAMVIFSSKNEDHLKNKSIFINTLFPIQDIHE